MEKKSIKYNVPQLFFLICGAVIRILEWGRGTGKSTILGKYIADCVTQMPRSTGVLVAASYAQIKTRTLPSTIHGLEMHGFYKDLHFVVGKKPPSYFKWPEAYEPPLDYKNTICFWNGTVIVFVSQDQSSSSGRGMNVDWVLGDEAAFLDKEKFETDVLLTNRGNMNRIAHYPDGSWKYFKDCPLHHSVTLATSTPVSASGRWILDYEKLAIQNPKKYAFIRASAYDNRENLGDDYFENAKKILSKSLYEAEIENKRMTLIQNSFYPKLSKAIHIYNDYGYQDFLLPASENRSCLSDKDLNVNDPLILGIDWGSRINCMIVCQEREQTLYALKDLHAISPNIVNDMIDDFMSYYADHQNKQIYLFYDPTGNNKQANSRQSLAQEAQSRLKKGGWKVALMTNGTNELHTLKFNLWKNILAEDPEENFPKFRMNFQNCNDLYISMSNAPAKQGMHEEIKKDKSSERSKKVLPQHATHKSDAMDVIVVGLYRERLFANQSKPAAPQIL